MTCVGKSIPKIKLERDEHESSIILLKLSLDRLAKKLKKQSLKSNESRYFYCYKTLKSFPLQVRKR